MFHNPHLLERRFWTLLSSCFHKDATRPLENLMGTESEVSTALGCVSKGLIKALVLSIPLEQRVGNDFARHSGRSAMLRPRSTRESSARKRTACNFVPTQPGGCAIWARVVWVGGSFRVSEWGGVRAERWNVLVDPFGKLRAGYGAPPGGSRRNEALCSTVSDIVAASSGPVFPGTERVR